MLVVSAFMLNVLTPVGGPPECASWHDPSRHQARFVTVEDGVRLEVLDWGGHGRSIVLLAGSGNTAHVFDGFAEDLAGGHHVYGITRRGYGASSHPGSGYTEKRLAEDVLRVLDSLRIAAPVLVGHSMAGEELTRLGNEHSDRLRGLVYLDAAADPADLPPSSPSYTELFDRLPEPMRTRPSPSASDLRSFVAYRDWRARAGEVAFPESELRNGFECNPDGSVGRFRTTKAIHEAIGAGAQRRDYARIRVPILALFAAPGGKPKYQPKGAEESAAIELYEAATAAFIDIGKKKLQSAAAGVRIVDLPGANHYLFLSNEADVLRELSAFVRGLQ